MGLTESLRKKEIYLHILR